jgi:CHAT domain-containing protein
VGRAEDAAATKERMHDAAAAEGKPASSPLVYLQLAASLYGEVGRHDKAVALRRRIAQERLNAHDVFHRDTDDALDSLRSAYVDAGRFAEATKLIDAVIEDYRRRGEASVFADRDATLAVARWFSRLGEVQLREGRLDDALATFQRVLGIRRRVLPDTDTDVIQAVVDIASVHRARGALADASRTAETVLRVATDRAGRDVAVRGLGPLLVDLGQLERARTLLQLVARESEEVGDLIRDSAAVYDDESFGMAEPIVRAVRERTHLIATKVRIQPLVHLGFAYLKMGDVAAASPVLLRALSLSEIVKDRSPGFVRLLTLVGQTEAALGRYDAALAHYERASDLSARMFRPGAPERIALLLGRADAESQRGRAAAATRLYEQAQGEAHLRPDALVRAEAHFGYAQHFARQKHWALAILLGKAAVNAAQSARASLGTAGQDIQQAFAKSRSTFYQTLAGWLVQQGRLPEAQQVLAMLKEDELFQYLRSGEAQDVRKTQATLSDEEEQWAARFAVIEKQLAAIGTELDGLARKAAAGLTPAEQARRTQLENDREVSQQAFEKFLGQLMDQLARTASAARNREIGRKDLGNLQARQGMLRDLGHGAVLLHYLVLDDRTHVILTTPQVQLVRETAVSADALNDAILRYREVLQDPSKDPLPLAQQLYGWLLAPVANDLRQARAQTLMVSLDGALRYLPLAALHDRSAWVAERYALAIYTEAATDRLKDRAAARWRLAGLGLTRPVQGFSPLPAVREELEGIVRGPLPGDVWLDEQFTADRLRAVLDGRPPVLHIASHFVFRPGAESNSFLLLGDGQPLSLAALKRYEFRDVDLITLSACETAVGGGKDRNGREIEGFGALAQRQGAKGVLATLWSVADRGTGEFMQTFYRIRQSRPGITKAEAVRLAQVELLSGRRDTAPPAGGALRHPFFWAPFILMGNWL